MKPAAPHISTECKKKMIIQIVRVKLPGGVGGGRQTLKVTSGTIRRELSRLMLAFDYRMINPLKTKRICFI
jgi:hypothetical protein